MMYSLSKKLELNFDSNSMRCPKLRAVQFPNCW